MTAVASTSWRCTCGNLNDGPFGCGENEDGRYDVCSRCGFEIYDTGSPTNKLKVVEKYLMVPVTEPWKAAHANSTL